MANIIRIEELVYSRLPHVSKADWVDMLSAQGVHIDYTTFKDEYLLLEHSDYRFENGKMISSERMVYNIDYLTYDQQRNAEDIEDTIKVPMAIYDCHTDRYTILYVHYPQSDVSAAPDLSHIFSETDAPEIILADPIRDIEPIEESILDILSLNSLTNMNKLEKLYESIRTLEELSIPLNPETLKAVDELEEKIIKDEILPALSEQVAPLLKPIQRDLVLVLEYHPGEEISVALSRKVKVAEMLGAKTIEKEDDQQPDVAATPTIPATTAPITTIPIAGVPFSVEFPDKEVIAEKKAVTTFVKSLQKFGLDKVQKLDINFSGYNLVSDVPCPLRGNSPLQHYVDGKYIFVNLSNAVKIKTIQKIASKLGINVLIQSV